MQKDQLAEYEAKIRAAMDKLRRYVAGEEVGEVTTWEVLHFGHEFEAIQRSRMYARVCRESERPFVESLAAVSGLPAGVEEAVRAGVEAAFRKVCEAYEKPDPGDAEKQAEMDFFRGK